MSEEMKFDANGIQTIELGDGSTIISELAHDDYSGVCFSKGAGVVGEFHPEIVGKKDHEIGAFLKIITDNPDSLQALIDRLKGARDTLLTKTAKEDMT